MTIRQKLESRTSLPKKVGDALVIQFSSEAKTGEWSLRLPCRTGRTCRPYGHPSLNSLWPTWGHSWDLFCSANNTHPIHFRHLFRWTESTGKDPTSLQSGCPSPAHPAWHSPGQGIHNRHTLHPVSNPFQTHECGHRSSSRPEPDNMRLSMPPGRFQWYRQIWIQLLRACGAGQKPHSYHLRNTYLKPSYHFLILLCPWDNTNKPWQEFSISYASLLRK